VAQAKAEAKELSEKTLEQAKAAVAEMLTKNEARMKLEKEAMMMEVKKEVASLVTLASAKVLGKSVKEADNQKLVDEMVKEVVK
jgi:F-type H+-transporting ATPase subunit b